MPPEARPSRIRAAENSASAILLEDEARAKERGARALARLAWWSSWRDPFEADVLADVPAPSRASIVLFGLTDARVTRVTENGDVAIHFGAMDDDEREDLALAIFEALRSGGS